MRDRRKSFVGTLLASFWLIVGSAQADTTGFPIGQPFLDLRPGQTATMTCASGQITGVVDGNAQPLAVVEGGDGQQTIPADEVFFICKESSTSPRIMLARKARTDRGNGFVSLNGTRLGQRTFMFTVNQ